MKLLSKVSENEVKKYIKLASWISYLMLAADLLVTIFLISFTTHEYHNYRELSFSSIIMITISSIFAILLFMDSCNRIIVIKNLKKLCTEYRETDNEERKKQILYSLNGYVIIHQLDGLKSILENNEKGTEYD
jgi:hypothetical protein